MSFFRRHRNPDSDQIDADDHDSNVDHDLRLRTVRTAASTIAESIASEQRARRRRSTRLTRSNFFRSKSTKYSDHEKTRSSLPNVPAVQITGKRRNVYVNMPLTATEVDRHGEPIIRYARNKVNTTSELLLEFCTAFFLYLLEYTIITFVPKNLYEQFRRYDTYNTPSLFY
jgi:phospholipid-translocating ATPase